LLQKLFVENAGYAAHVYLIVSFLPYDTPNINYSRWALRASARVGVMPGIERSSSSVAARIFSILPK
jgi:hypothetical protein